MESMSFTRTPEEMANRKYRAKLYMKIRPENEKAWNRYSNKKKADDSDPFSDLLGGSSADEGPQLKLKSVNPKDMMKHVKSTYQKLATLNKENKDTIINAILSVKLNKFLEETVNHIMLAKFSQFDIPAFVEVISLLHQLYKEFVPMIGPRILQEIDNKENTFNRRRNYCRLFADLLIVRCFRSPNPFNHIFMKLVNLDCESKKFENEDFIWGVIAHAGGDIFGVDRGQNTIIDAIWPRDPPGTQTLRSELSRYYKTLIEQINTLCKEGKAAYEKGYTLIIKFGSIKCAPIEEGKRIRAEYDRLRSVASKFAFVMKKEVEDPWVDDEEMVERTTIDGSILIPKRLMSQSKDEAPMPAPMSRQDAFYSVLADMEVSLAQPLDFDIYRIKTEVDRAIDAARVDLLSRHYALIDKPEDRQTVVDLFSSISRQRANQAPFYARFVANVSQLFHEIGDGVASKLRAEYFAYVSAAAKGKGGPAKIHIARYLAELGRFGVGIAEYFDCVSFTLKNFRPRTAEMVCTLINISGKYFDGLCDQTHTNIRNILSELTRRKPEIATHQYAVLMVEQTVAAIDPPPAVDVVFYANAHNEYQAFITEVFHSQIEQPNFAQKAVRFILKLIKEKERTLVDLPFIYNLVLDLKHFAAAQMPSLAMFVAEFSRVVPEFGTTISDIVYERIRRGIEVPVVTYRQRLILEARFLAELASPPVSVLSVTEVLRFANFILSYNAPNPRGMLVRVETKSGQKSVFKANRDFHRVFVVATILDACTEAFKENSEGTLQFAKHVYTHLQVYVLVRAPIPSNVAFRVSDLLQSIRTKVPGFCGSGKITSIESIETAREYSRLYGNQLQTFYSIDGTVRPREISHASLTVEDLRDSDDAEEEDHADELYEQNFSKEMAEFMESLDKTKDTKRHNVEKLKIPVELLSAPPAAVPRMNSKNGPVEGFEIYTAKNDTIALPSAFEIPPK